MVETTILSETLHLLFVGMPFYDEGVNLDVPLYFLFSQIGSTSLVTSIIIFIFILKETIESKFIAFGLILWNIKEVIDEIQYIRGENFNVFEINDSFWGQIVLIHTIILLAIVGYLTWKR